MKSSFLASKRVIVLDSRGGVLVAGRAGQHYSTRRSVVAWEWESTPLQDSGQGAGVGSEGTNQATSRHPCQAGFREANGTVHAYRRPCLQHKWLVAEPSQQARCQGSLLLQNGTLAPSSSICDPPCPGSRVVQAARDSDARERETRERESLGASRAPIPLSAHFSTPPASLDARLFLHA